MVELYEKTIQHTEAEKKDGFVLIDCTRTPGSGRPKGMHQYNSMFAFQPLFFRQLYGKRQRNPGSQELPILLCDPGT